MVYIWNFLRGSSHVLLIGKSLGLIGGDFFRLGLMKTDCGGFRYFNAVFYCRHVKFKKIDGKQIHKYEFTNMKISMYRQTRSKFSTLLHAVFSNDDQNIFGKLSDKTIRLIENSLECTYAFDIYADISVGIRFITLNDSSSYNTIKRYFKCYLFFLFWKA